ncbi:MAG: hypothetical protein OEZ13_01885 [Spirochaetia bacterium]|nr:hypothetical protein [Spirochaetia bacterium]
MRYGDIPEWLKKLEKKLGFIALPNLALYLIVLQIFGFLIYHFKGHAVHTLYLIPQKVLEGEIWRLFTFMAVPLSTGFWIILVLFFLYFVVTTLEREWGEFPVTFYLLITVLLTIAFSFIFNRTINDFTPIEMTLFLAAATTFPDVEILLFIFPVKLKWLAIFVVASFLFTFLQSDMLYKIYILIVFSNYFIFFGPAFIHKLKQAHRRRRK